MASSQPYTDYSHEQPRVQLDPKPRRDMTLTKQDPYIHIRGLPSFPIHAPSDTEALNKAYNTINQRKTPYNDIHAPIANGSAALSMSLLTKPRITFVLSRYSTPVDCSFLGILVDVVEMRGNSSWQGNVFRLRASRECCILVQNKWKIRLKAGSMWSKSANWKPVEAISVEVENNTMIPLGLVGCWHRPVAVAERQEIFKRFEKEYKMPEMIKVTKVKTS